MIPKSKNIRTELVICAVIMLTGIAGLILVGGEKPVFLCAAAAVWAAVIIKIEKNNTERSKKVSESAKRVIIALLFSVLSQVFTAPLFTASTGAWRYPVIKKYVELYSTVGDISWLPDKMDSSVKDYKLSYAPTVMQGSGYFNVRFKCSSKEAAKWADYGNKHSKSVFSGLDLDDDWNYYVTDEITGQKVFADLGYDLDFSITQADRDFWQGHLDGAEIFVIYATTNSNHPHFDLVIVNKTEGMVQLSHG